MRRHVLAFLILFLSVISKPASLVRGPILQNVGPHSATITWWTDDESKGWVLYSTVGSSFKEESKRGKMHRVRLTNLKPSTPYTYIVEGDGYRVGPFTFKTAPWGEEKFLFGIYGDTRTGHDIHRKVIEALMKWKPSFLLHTGDLVGDGTREEDWERFFQISHPFLAQVPLYPVLGNHEKNSPLYFRYFALPGRERYYSFNWGQCHFIALDSNPDFLTDRKQMEFLEEDLQRYKDASFIIVFFHHPPFTAAKGREEYAEKVRKAFVPLLEKAKVSVVFLGHDHNYQHFLVNGIRYLVLGGGGAPLYDITPVKNLVKAEKTHNYAIGEVKGDRMVVRVYRLDGTLLDKVEILPRVKTAPLLPERLPHLDLWRLERLGSGRK